MRLREEADSLASFLLLLRNELLKIRARRISWVLLAAMVLTAAAVNGLQWMSYRQLGRDVLSSQEQLQSQIDALEASRPEGWEVQANSLRFLLDNGIDVNVDSWRLAAAQRMADDLRTVEALCQSGSPEDQARGDALLQSVEEDRRFILAQDYRGYYEKRIAAVGTDGSLPQERRERLLWQSQYVLDEEVAARGNEWKYSLMRGMVSAMSELESLREQAAWGGGVNREYRDRLEEVICAARFRIEENLKTVAGDASTGFYYEEQSPFWQSMELSLQATAFLALAVILLAGGAIAREHTAGTIRELLPVPARRGTVLCAKYAAVLTWAGLLAAVFFLAWLVSCLCFFGPEDAGAAYVYVSGGEAGKVPGLLRLFWRYLLALVPVLFYGTCAFCAAALWHSTALSVGIGALCLFVGPHISSWLKYSLRQDWPRYLIFSNLDLYAVQQGSDVFPGQTLAFSLAVLAVHFLVLMLTAWDAFVYQDVK